jgi:hypothetical protein
MTTETISGDKPDCATNRADRRWRKSARFTRWQDHCRKVEARTKTLILRLARALERRTRRPGKINGLIGDKGLRLLEWLLICRTHASTGQCDPGYDEIQAALGYAHSTIADLLRRLEHVGLVRVARRLVRKTVLVDGVPRLTTVQTTNAYSFSMPSDGAESLPILHGRFKAVLAKAVRTDLRSAGVERPTGKTGGPQSLADVLAQFGRNVAARARG